LDGAPVMRFFNRLSSAVGPTDDALATRLGAIADRGKLEIAGYAGSPPVPVEKRFWSPDEVEVPGAHND
jgi:hypothetical protein